MSSIHWIERIIVHIKKADWKERGKLVSRVLEKFCSDIAGSTQDTDNVDSIRDGKIKNHVIPQILATKPDNQGVAARARFWEIGKGTAKRLDVVLRILWSILRDKPPDFVQVGIDLHCRFSTFGMECFTFAYGFWRLITLSKHPDMPGIRLKPDP